MNSIAFCDTRVVLAVLALMAAAANAQADDFYTNRQIKLLIGNNAGTSYDLSARLVGRHLGRHIPGEPSLVPQNMPGASGVIATNYAYNIAPKDGSVIVATVQTVPQRQVLGDENVKFDAAKLSWIGNPASSVNVIVTWRTALVKTFEDARRQPTLMAATTRDASSGIEVALANNLLGAKFHLVAGYKGNEIDLAMERGEVQGRAGQSWDGWKITHPDWIEQRKLNVLVQVGLKPSAELKDVPYMLALARSQEQRQIMELYSAPITLGRPLFVGPNVPVVRIAILRRAFRETMSDPAFLSDAKKLHYDVNPVWGEELQAIVARILTTPAAVVAKAKDAMEYRN
jgi:tripartite-type tricarboxylate transporter receptor subunit TctC